MMWNFRLVKHVELKPKHVWYGVHEVFYNDDGKPWTMTKEPVQVDGESAKDVAAYLRSIQHDLKHLPVLDADKIKWAKPPAGIRRGRTEPWKSVKCSIDSLSFIPRTNGTR